MCHSLCVGDLLSLLKAEYIHQGKAWVQRLHRKERVEGGNGEKGLPLEHSEGDEGSESEEPLIEFSLKVSSKKKQGVMGKKGKEGSQRQQRKKNHDVTKNNIINK